MDSDEEDEEKEQKAELNDEEAYGKTKSPRVMNSTTLNNEIQFKFVYLYFLLKLRKMVMLILLTELKLLHST